MTQPVFEQVADIPNASFSIENVVKPYFTSLWHFHPQVEIIGIERGNGTVFVGDYIGPFGPGTVALIGSNVPHVWQNDANHFSKDSGLIAESRVIKFNETFGGDVFLQLPELVRVRQLFLQSQRGLLFSGDTAGELFNEIRILFEHEGMERLIRLMRLLHRMSETTEYQLMASSAFTNVYDQNDCDRMSRIYKFVTSNFRTEISLSQAAEIAHLSETAFCRYFKSRTLKTFSYFVNEIRVGHACKLLIETDKSIFDVCCESGFNHLSNFYKQFKLYRHCTPHEYRDKYRVIGG